MTYETRYEKTQHSHQGPLASCGLGLPALSSLRGFIATSRKATIGHPGIAWAECHPQRGYKPRPQGNGRSWMVKPIQPWRSRSGATAIRPVGTNPARLKDGLQPVRLHAVPTGLRLIETGCETGLLPDHGLHAAGHAGETSNGSEPSPVAKGQKNANGSPATGRSGLSSSRHGTKPPVFQCCFVPPRVTYID